MEPVAWCDWVGGYYEFAAKLTVTGQLIQC